nr:PREDICTED: uncharacterized protein LOC105675442 isoform X2 [Linepithema humile]
MFRQKGLLLFTCLLAFTINLTLALPSGAPWTNFVSQPVYSRSLGPPLGMDTISVPYAPKSPLFPKFVDPKMLISKKTDMLSNLFGGIGPVAYNIPDAEPIASYGPLANANALLDSKKSSSMYKRGMFGPFTPKFGPMGPKFGPVMSSSLPKTLPDYNTASFRKKRSVVPSFADDTNSVLDGKTDSDPSQIIESMSAIKSTADDTPKEYPPGMFGPFGPSGLFGSSGSFGPVVDPSAFIAKKSAFLDTLFKNLATSTPASATTDVPAPKSTIVPPSFWIPSSVIPSPTEYSSKVSDFLDKLFDSLNLNATAAQGAADGSDAKSDFLRSVKSDDISPNKIARSLNDASSIAVAKDAIVDTILSELGDLKSDMLETLNDLITYEKTAAAAASTAKKPFKPFAGVFPFAKPTVDPTLPFKQRMDVLSQVFDMLTDLQRNITAAAKSATTASPDTGNDSASPKIPLDASGAIGASSINSTLLNAVLKKISAIESASPAFYPVNPMKESPITSRALPKESTSWVSYSKNLAPAEKRQVDDDLLPYLEYENSNDQQNDNHRQYTRGVQMQMHQGYQSLPAGSVESVQAGGGSTPGHQGGGIKLLIQMPKLPNSQPAEFYSTNYN